jgi:class 3 adenylate cyclase
MSMMGESRTSGDRPPGQLDRDPDPRLVQGRDAHGNHAWEEAYRMLTAVAGAVPLDAVDLGRLAEAAWWTGHLADCIAAREQAYAASVSHDPAAAAIAGIELARNYFAKGDASVASAWLSRAERLLADAAPCVAHGYLSRMQAVIAFERDHDSATALERSRTTLEIATRFRDRDLMAMALHDQGRVLVSLGEVAQGNALIDEATVAAVGGEVSPFAAAVIYCNTITTCMNIADYVRASQWTEAAKRWCERQTISGFPGTCRVYRASVLRLRGAWSEAENEARRACEELRGFNRGYLAAALYELGEVRLRAGDLTAAAEAFREAHELGRVPEPGLSLLRLAEGKTKPALAAIRRALGDTTLDRLSRARLLPAYVQAALAAGELDDARAVANELRAIADSYATPALHADALHASGAVALAAGRGSDAIPSLRRAVQLWGEANCPYEAARSRVLLASAYGLDGDTDAAALEMEAARSAFESLGARLDLDRLGGPVATDVAEGPAGAERVTRTFMFTDIVRSTGLVEAIGDEAWADLLQWHDRTLRTLFAGHGGQEIDHAGDGFFVAFPEPGPALACAVAIQRTLSEHRRAHGFAPQVRIGLHATTSAHRRGGYQGKGVHEAARIAAIAEGGQIVASVGTMKDAISFPRSAPRSVQLSGLHQPIDLVTIDWRS